MIRVKNSFKLFKQKTLVDVVEECCRDQAEHQSAPENIQAYQPGGNAFYESSAFTPDGAKLLFFRTFASGNFWKNQIHSLDLAAGTTQRPNQSEHPSLSPNGKTIIYMSDHQSELPGTNWWLMNPDGTNKRRITFVNQRGHPTRTVDPYVLVLLPGALA